METNQQQMDTSLTLWSLQSSGAQRQTSSTIAVRASCSSNFTCVNAFSPHKNPVR